MIHFYNLYLHLQHPSQSGLRKHPGLQVDKGEHTLINFLVASKESNWDFALCFLISTTHSVVVEMISEFL